MTEARSVQSAPCTAYRIETPRLVLRCWAEEDAASLHEAIRASLAHLRPWMPWANDESSETVATKVERLRRFREAFDRREDFIYGIFDSSERAVIGGTGLHTRAGKDAREIGYWIHAAHVRRGYATESTAALTRVAFEIDRVTRVEIKCDPLNRASAAVPEKIGYTLEGVRKAAATGADGGARDEMVWSMSAREYMLSDVRGAELRAFDKLGREIALG